MSSLNSKQMIIIAIVGAFMVGIVVFYFYSKNTNEETLDLFNENIIESNQTETKEENDKQEKIIIVHIAGEVKRPGIIKIEEGARIADVIDKAEGLKEEADLTNINLAYPVEDGQKIIIPKKGEELQEYITEDSQTQNLTSKQDYKINLNKANLEELQTLQGIRRSNCTKNYRV